MRKNSNMTNLQFLQFCNQMNQEMMKAQDRNRNPNTNQKTVSVNQSKGIILGSKFTSPSSNLIRVFFLSDEENPAPSCLLFGDKACHMECSIMAEVYNTEAEGHCDDNKPANVTSPANYHSTKYGKINSTRNTCIIKSTITIWFSNKPTEYSTIH